MAGGGVAGGGVAGGGVAGGGVAGGGVAGGGVAGGGVAGGGVAGGGVAGGGVVGKLPFFSLKKKLSSLKNPFLSQSQLSLSSPKVSVPLPFSLSSRLSCQRPPTRSTAPAIIL